MNEKRKHTKTHRIQVLLDILTRWGRLDKNQICLHLGNNLGENSESESFQRAVYRDLEDLVQDSRIAVDYFGRDGVLIEDYDSTVHKNISCQWFLPEAEGQITGGGNLKKMNGLVYVPKLMKNDFGIIGGNSHPDPRHRHFYFQVGHQFLCLKASFEAFPFSIAVSRTNGEISPFEIEEVKKKLGSRTIILKFPDPTLSSYKAELRQFHCLITMNNESELEILDSGTPNGTCAFQLTPTEADGIREQGAKLGEQTITSTWNNLNNFLVRPEAVTITLRLKPPALVDVGGGFKVLVI